MIEKQIINKKIRELLIQKYIDRELPKACYSKIDLKKTPLGEKIIVHTAKPGLVVGRKGANIDKITSALKINFKMENPQVEIAELENPNLDPRSIAETIVSSFERFGPKRFKSMGYRELQKIIDAGAIGAEIVISGRGVPSKRSKTWRFSEGHLKKSGDISANHMKKATVIANLKSGAIGIKVNILTPDIRLPDDLRFKYKEEEKPKEETKEEKEKNEIKKEETKEEKKETKKVKKKKVKENGNKK